MWMSDKAHVQRELGENLAQLIEELTVTKALLFWKACWITLEKEWMGIDR